MESNGGKFIKFVRARKKRKLFLKGITFAFTPVVREIEGKFKGKIVNWIL